MAITTNQKDDRKFVVMAGAKKNDRKFVVVAGANSSTAKQVVVLLTLIFPLEWQWKMLATIAVKDKWKAAPSCCFNCCNNNSLNFE